MLLVPVLLRIEKNQDAFEKRMKQELQELKEEQQQFGRYGT